MTKGQQPKDIFDVKRIREIIELMEEHDLSAVDLQQGEEKIKLNRGGVSPVYSAPPPVAAAAAAVDEPAQDGAGRRVGARYALGPAAGTVGILVGPCAGAVVRTAVGTGAPGRGVVALGHLEQQLVLDALHRRGER